MLAPGLFYGIVGPKRWGELGIWIVPRDVDIDKINSINDLTEKMVTIKLINGKTGAWLLIHKGGYKQDYSLLCISMHPDDWFKFLKLLTIGQKFLIQLV